MTEYEALDVNLDDLLLDPNNYRFQHLAEFQMAVPHRLHEELVQQRAYERIRSDGLTELKASILKNGYLPVERIIVRPYEHQSGKYLVLEGNRRVSALRWIRSDYEAGVDVPETIRLLFEAVPVLGTTSLDGTGTDYLALMGIRHVSGIRPWGGYQEAKLVFDMREHDLEPTEIGDRLGISVREINRRLRAFRSLRQMQEDEEFSGSATPNLYAIFHEAVSLPVLREWIGWDLESEEFVEGENLQAFYGLISPTIDDEGEKESPKIGTYAQVRDLRYIIPDISARTALLDPEMSLTDAAAIAQQDRLVASWRTQVAEAMKALDNLPWPVVKGLDEEQVRELEGFREKIDETINSHKILKQA